MDNEKKEKCVFEVTFECENCSYQFTEKFKKGEYVSKDNVWSRINVKVEACEHSVSCKKCYMITCTMCGYEKLTIKERKLITPF